jgi:hypothetical protein
MAAGAGDASGAAKKLLEPPLKTGHSTLDCLDALFSDAEEVKFSKDAVVSARTEPAPCRTCARRRAA